MPAPIIRIAYAEDLAIVRKGVATFINSFQNCRVTIEAGNGQELLAALKSAAELPDICILDIFMPELNGPDTLTEIRKIWPQMKVLVLTGQTTEYYQIIMIRAGANGYLHKSCSPKELEQAIRCIYGTGIFHADAEAAGYYEDIVNRKIGLPGFTEQEVLLLQHCCSDLGYEQIADRLGVTMRSIDWTRNSLFKKLNVKSRSGLVMYAVQLGLVPMDVDNKIQ